MSDFLTLGNLGCYLDDGNAITFQVGTDPSMRIGVDPHDCVMTGYGRDILSRRWLNVDGYNILSRGVDNRKCERIEKDIKNNRLLPRLINKQVNMLYGKGPYIYKSKISDGKIIREWREESHIKTWLEGWQKNGMEMSYTDFGLALIKRYYFFRDYFVKNRFSWGKAIGRLPVAGLELMENKLCRLGTTKQDVSNDIVLYNDFRFIIVGNWNYGAAKFKVYPLYRENEVDNYHFAAISHHRESSVGEHYGENETHEGVKTHLKTSNELPEYIDSFLNNSLAAKIHVIIPAAWVEAKRKQIKSLCEENKARQKENNTLLKYNDIEIGTEYRESTVVLYMKMELRRLSQYLSGKDNQGKAFSTLSFRSGQDTVEERWKIETIDLKYKEYIESLITYDKHINEVLLGSVGLDASISGISKDGVISKSGADVYYNYLLYLLSLTPDDEKCSEPFNNAMMLNWPDLYAEGYRIGYYRETPSRQEEVSTKDRLSNQQS
ncbi:MAG: hypothetical protein LBS88_06935 [Tannerellaceae bacterium]|jgi:hypothetical protein|nr:hypothetical protein [Tannerellaceae bacterium]